MSAIPFIVSIRASPLLSGLFLDGARLPMRFYNHPTNGSVPSSTATRVWRSFFVCLFPKRGQGRTGRRTSCVPLPHRRAIVKGKEKKRSADLLVAGMYPKSDLATTPFHFWVTIAEANPLNPAHALRLIWTWSEKKKRPRAAI